MMELIRGSFGSEVGVLGVKIECCRLLNGAAGAFVECIHSDRGPIKLNNCKIGNQILADALTGNRHVTRLKPYRETTDADMAFLFAALAKNRGLENLDLHSCCISDNNWSVLCESLNAHPTLTSLVLGETRPTNLSGDRTLATCT
jgi:hypothetical protein